MKKILVLLLCITMVCSMFACGNEADKTDNTPDVQEEEQQGEQTEKTVYSESFPLGGSLPAFPLEGKALGNYTELDDLGAFYFDGCSEIHVYADETCDTPYIAVYRWSKDGKTFEETVQVEADSRNFGIAQFTEKSGITGGKSAFFCRHISDEESADNNFYYINSVFFEDGEDIVEIDFLAASEEIQVGNTDTYLWVPTGYTSLMTDDRTNHGVTFYGEYDASYDYPSIWICKVDYSYEMLKWFWDGWEGEFPITEEKYAEYCAQEDWSDETEIEYYSAFNAEITYKNTDGKGSLYGIHFADGWGDCEDAYFTIGGDDYEIWMEIPESEFTPRIGMSLLDSIHTKGGSAETIYSESIPLGGNAGEYKLEGPAYGNYTELTDIDEFLYEGCTYTHVYADETCDTPYIAVYRWAKDGMTLEETAKSLAEYWNGGYYEIVDGADWEAKADKLAYLCYSYEENGQYFYIDTMLFEDGDEFVNIDAYAKSVEVQIADTNTYMWVPAGYTDILTDDDKANGGLFWGKYDESYYFPTIWMAKANFSYDYFTLDWSYEYPDGLPFTEEEFDALVSTFTEDEYYLTDEHNTAFYALFGCDVKYYTQNNYNGIDTDLTVMSSPDGSLYYTDIIFTVDGVKYEIWTETDELIGTPYIGTSLLKSLHTK